MIGHADQLGDCTMSSWGDDSCVDRILIRALFLGDHRILWSENKGPATHFAAVILFAGMDVPLPLIPGGATLRTCFSHDHSTGSGLRFPILVLAKSGRNLTRALLGSHHRAFQGWATTDCGASTDEQGNRDGLNWNAEASRAEEPGAGKPHAGLCAGVVGHPAVRPRWRHLILCNARRWD